MILTVLVPNFTRPTFPFAAGSRPLLAPHFDLHSAFFLKVFSHFLKSCPFLRTPLPIRPVFDPFSRGGAQNRLTPLIIPNFPDLTRVCLLRIREWTRMDTKHPRMDAKAHELKSFVPCNNLPQVLTYQGRPPTKGPNRAVIRLFVIHSGTVSPAKNSAQAWLAHSIFRVDRRSFAVSFTVSCVALFAFIRVH